ncbi:hypothetical protein [Haladaptatus sp. DYF46]|uniref:hypothetical protein n=1 Tax=Haladaptatus sp. DYF46 TaxID=2886041 RepID=UPI001E5A394F|nr:hypothetical protein [Haladaptatus sp. DYF46]
MTQRRVRRIHDREARCVLVRGWKSPIEPLDTVVAFDAGFVATYRGDTPNLPVYVTTPKEDGRERRRFDTRTLLDATDYVARMLSDGVFDAVWFRQHPHLVDCLHPIRVGALERRLAETAEGSGATLVTWTDETTPANDAVYDDIVES